MTISTVPTERLKQIASGKAFTCTQDDESASMAAELLAVREAQRVPVAWQAVSKVRCNRMTTLNKEVAADWAFKGFTVTPLYTAPLAPAPVAYANISDWGIDRSAGVPILVYKKCSVIESETAEYVLSLIKNAATPAPALQSDVEAVLALPPDAVVAALTKGMERYKGAMLHLSAPAVLTFDEWIRKQTAPIDTDCGMVGVEVMVHWMREAYNATVPARKEAHPVAHALPKETSWKEAEAITDSLETEIRNLIDDPTADNATCLVRSVIDACRAAMLQPVSQGYTLPAGFKLVPIEPTPEMCNLQHIGVDVYTGMADDGEPYSIGGADAAKIYRAMLAAAPTPNK
ncbi:hypothetical protein AV650_22305 [Serratia fonticola]|nr:hypothetical protein AV650_22305 [Serratia fonticola]